MTSTAFQQDNRCFSPANHNNQSSHGKTVYLLDLAKYNVRNIVFIKIIYFLELTTQTFLVIYKNVS